ncbi:DNA repair protein RAD2, putative [Plasmodium gallinaceum]|uniref:DNA repair protein RAD2, putative n=1 Tax=Plasmodium gallinaceum TaxID=5849 RepID=A0A1J1GT07_PLAGA|nr:DNA repair protein RAD2, putative [Plasmodium gallinaceum]CRG95414.1 DNA repair protein RAD2, putative [Plasmodium gallinaceum]
MGVKGLWSIVSPAGIRVNPEIFTGKRIAIDVSIWLYELTYANNLKVLKNNSFDNLSIFNDLWIDFSQNMNNEIKTDNLKKAHLYFFFLRICKLLYYNIRPIFIFDGNPPELKKKTIFQRNLKKRNYEEKFRKTAEKLIYNYYQRTLLKSLKNKKNISNKKKDNEKRVLLHKKEVSNRLKNNSLDSCGIIDNDNSLSNIVEKVGNLTISMKDVLNFCNDDLDKIENKVLMITNSNTISDENNKNEGLDENELINNDKKEKYITNNKCEDISKEYIINDEDDNESDSIGDDEEKSTIKKNDINNLDNKINEEIVRKKHIAKKKYYENIPQNFKGFLSMRRPVDIIDISNYNTDILEYTQKYQHIGEKYNNVYKEDALLKDDFNSSNNYNLVSKNEKKNNSEDIEYIPSSNDDFFLLEDKKDSTSKKNDKENESNTLYGMEVNRKDINILELPSNITSSNIFLDGKDEYKVYYINNEEIKIPLFKEINKDVFEKLPIKLQYQILQDIKEEWYADNRIKAIKSKDDMDVFSQVQLETYVRMIKTDFEIEKLKIKMAENIQNVEGELIINKELSKNLENLNVRDYNDIKKKKKKKKKYLNEILNNCYLNNKNNLYDLMINNEEEDEEKVKEKSNNIKEYNYNDKDTYENVEIKNNKMDKDVNRFEEEKKKFIKMEDDFKKDLLMDDKQIFGDDFFDLDDDNTNRDISNMKCIDKLNENHKEQIECIYIESSNEYELNKKYNASHWEKDDLKKIVNKNTKSKINYENGKIKSKLQKIEQKENEKSNFSSSDDFENCSVEEKKDINELVHIKKDMETHSNNNIELFKEYNKKGYNNLKINDTNELIKNINTDYYTNNKTYIKTNELEEKFTMENENHINMKNIKTNDTFNYQQRIKEDINFITKENEFKIINPKELNKDIQVKESLNNEILYDNIIYIEKNKNIEGSIDNCFSSYEYKNTLNYEDENILINKDKNILINEDENILINEDKNILINEDKNILINEDKNILINEDENILINEDKNILINEDKNILINEDKNILINEDKNILINEDKNILINEDENILINKDENTLNYEDENILINKDENTLNYEDKNILINEDENILINEDKNILINEDKNILNNKDKNILIDEYKNTLHDEDKNILIDEYKNTLHDEDKNILINENENIMKDMDKNTLINENENIMNKEDKNISKSEDKNNIDEIKKKGKINKIMSKQQINNILLNKCDLNKIEKENFFEQLLNNKEIMDKFSVQVEEKEKLKEDKNDEYAYYEYLEDNKIIDSYINKTNKENEELIKEFKRLKKNNIEINDEMNDDVKILLDFFGIPYIQSPCEAEAQCSYLNNKNYCDAIISDDSDVLVFNGKTVIKNFFNKKKTVEVYEKKIIEDKLGLYQEELINISLLCGCDYTTGVHGIGIVNALEIIKAFPTFEDLKKLKDIVSNPFREINEDEYSEEIKTFLNTHKNYKLNWIFPNNFPDREVYKCFKYPKVCTDIKKFQWNFPNINNICIFLNKTTNIPKEKIFNVLNPILQKYDIKIRSYQLKIEDFFPIIERKRKNINDLIDTVRENKKNKKKFNENMELDKNVSTLIDINPAGIIKSKRMTTALDYLKRRKSKKKK